MASWLTAFGLSKMRANANAVCANTGMDAEEAQALRTEGLDPTTLRSSRR